jgi:hypothetical protein
MTLDPILTHLIAVIGGAGATAAFLKYVAGWKSGLAHELALLRQEFGISAAAGLPHATSGAGAAVASGSSPGGTGGPFVSSLPPQAG